MLFEPRGSSRRQDGSSARRAGAGRAWRARAGRARRGDAHRPTGSRRRHRPGHTQCVHGNVECPVDGPGVDRVDLVLEAPLLLDQRVHLLVGGDVSEGGVDLLEAVEKPLGVGNAKLDVAPDVEGLVELGLLRQIADVGLGVDPDLAVDVLVETGHDPEQRRLTGAVGSDDADLGAPEVAEPNAIEDGFAIWRHLPEALHRINEFLRHGRAHTSPPAG